MSQQSSTMLYGALKKLTTKACSVGYEKRNRHKKKVASEDTSNNSYKTLTANEWPFIHFKPVMLRKCSELLTVHWKIDWQNQIIQLQM